VATRRPGDVRIVVLGAVGLALLAVAFIGVPLLVQRLAPDQRSTEAAPLALASGELGGDDALTSGALRLSGDCAVLEHDDARTTLIVWPASRTTWEADLGIIRFERRDGGILEVADGATVRFAGSGGSFDSGDSSEGVKRSEWLASVEWSVEPAAECHADGFWFVGDIVDPTGNAP
jgi:hypothetical protein